MLADLAIPPLLIMSALALAFRYRLEFYPFLELAALVGFAELAGNASLGAKARGWVAAGGAWSIVAAQAMWVLTMLSPFGPVQNIIGPDGVAASTTAASSSPLFLASFPRRRESRATAWSLAPGPTPARA